MSTIFVTLDDLREFGLRNLDTIFTCKSVIDCFICRYLNERYNVKSYYYYDGEYHLNDGRVVITPVSFDSKIPNSELSGKQIVEFIDRIINHTI